MYSSKNKNSKLKICNQKHFLLSSFIAMGIICPTNLISQPSNSPTLNEGDRYLNRSFISKAVEKTGSSVVTIDTQRYVKKEDYQEILHY